MKILSVQGEQAVERLVRYSEYASSDDSLADLGVRARDAFDNDRPTPRDVAEAIREIERLRRHPGFSALVDRELAHL